MSCRPLPLLTLLPFASICFLTLIGSSSTPAARGRSYSQAPVSSTGPKVNRLTPPRAKEYHHATHYMAAAFYDTRGRWSSRLTLNNKGPEAKRPRVTLYSYDGRALVVPDVEVPGNGFTDIDLDPLVAHADPGFRFGSVRMAYHGDMLEMGAQVVVADLARGLQFDEQLSYAPTGGSPRQEAVWWLPSGHASFSVALLNRSAEPIVVRADLHGISRSGSAAAHRLDEVRLGPNEMRQVSINPQGRHASAMGSAGGLSLRYEGPAGALLARGMVHDVATGYSSPIGFSDPASAKTATYHGGGVRLQVDDTALTPVIVARNAGDVPTTLMGNLVVTTTHSEVMTIALPTRSLAPGESAVIESLAAVEEARALGARDVGVKFEYTTAPGTVVVNVVSFSPDRNHVFRVPLIDPETPASSTGGYPWRADGTIATVVHLKNTTDAPQTYLLQLTYPGGAYAPGLRTLQPGQALTLDIEALRDEQIPDAQGRTIPLDARSGQVHWSAKGPDRSVIIGRAEHVDRDHAVSASYACINCCPDNPESNWTVQDPISVTPGETVDVFSYLQDRDCYGNLLEPYYLGGWWGQSWYVANTGIAYGNDNATMTGVQSGDTNFYLTYNSEWWYPDVYEGGWFCNYTPYPVTYQAPVRVQTPTFLRFTNEPQYTDEPPAPYTFIANRRVVDEGWRWIERVMFVMERFDPPTPTGNCGLGQIETADANTDQFGVFGPDLYYVLSALPGGCASSSTQRFTVRLGGTDHNIQTSYRVTYRDTGVTVSCLTGCQ
jgi:hypothetical protein